MGNPVIRKISPYRKTMILTIKSLTYLDDRPVFEKERLATEAFEVGGVEGERLERERQRQVEKDAHTENINALRRIQEENRAKRLEMYGPDVEEALTPALQAFQDAQFKLVDDMDRVKEDSDTSAFIALAAEPNAMPSVRQAAIIDVTGKKGKVLEEVKRPVISVVGEDVPALDDATAEVEFMREQRDKPAIEMLANVKEAPVEEDERYVVNESVAERKPRVLIEEIKSEAERLEEIDFSGSKIIELEDEFEELKVDKRSGKAGWKVVESSNDKDVKNVKDEADEEATLD